MNTSQCTFVASAILPMRQRAFVLPVVATLFAGSVGPTAIQRGGDIHPAMIKKYEQDIAPYNHAGDLLRRWGALKEKGDD